jgi:hypothetical protein
MPGMQQLRNRTEEQVEIREHNHIFLCPYSLLLSHGLAHPQRQTWPIILLHHWLCNHANRGLSKYAFQWQLRYVWADTHLTLLPNAPASKLKDWLTDGLTAPWLVTRWPPSHLRWFYTLPGQSSSLGPYAAVLRCTRFLYTVVKSLMSSAWLYTHLMGWRRRCLIFVWLFLGQYTYFPFRVTCRL